MAMKKADLIKILVEEYGYEKEDIKLFTNAKLQSLIKQEEKDAEDFERQETIDVVTQSKFDDRDEIAIMSGANGAFKHKSREGRIWMFKEFGQRDKMPYKELLAIQNAVPRVLTDGYIVVLNKEVQDVLGLTELYKNIITPENLESVLKKDVTELEAFIDGLPNGMKITFVAKAREMYLARELYDIRIVEMIEQKFGFSLADNAPLSDTFKA
jgi:hypothetical protein